MNIELAKTELEFLDKLISEIEDKIVYKGKDDTGARVYTLTTECEIERLAARASNTLNPLKWQGETSDETVELLTWLDEHPATTNRLAVITTKSGTNIQLWNKDPDPGDGIRIDVEDKDLYEYITGKGTCQKTTEEKEGEDEE